MALGIIVGIIILAGIVGSLFMTIEFTRDSYGDINGFQIKRPLFAIVTIILLLAFLIVPFGFHTIDTGEVAVVKQLGEAKRVESSGTSWAFWMTNKYQKYDAKVQNKTIKTAAYSSDAQTMELEIALQYQIKVDKVMDIAKQYGKLEDLETRLLAIVNEKTKAVMSEHNANNIISDRAAMSPAVEESIRKAVGDKYYVDIVSVSITNIDFSDAFESAVEEKMIAEQKQLKTQYDNETKVSQAEAESKAKILKAEGEAKANELLEKSLTDKILQEMYLEKWDGKLPTVVSDGNTMFQVPSIR